MEKLDQEAVKVFLAWFYDDLMNYLNAPKTSLPGTFIILLMKTSASYYWVDCAMVFLLWLLEYKTQREFEKLYGLPHSFANTIINFMIKHVSIFPFPFLQRVYYFLASFCGSIRL